MKRMYDLTLIKRHLQTILLSVFIGIVIIIAYSVAQSGIGYMYDADEIARVQESYLIATGHMPFLDYYTIYSPIFPVLMLPIFWVHGFTFLAVDTVRFFMVALFFVRVGATAYLTYLLFGKRTALFFIPIFLLDPFTVFTSMQVRADNVMILVLTLGLILLARALQKNQTKLAGWSGAVLALSFCINVKSFLTLIILGVVFLVYTLRTKKIPMAKSFVAGGLVVGALYILPFLLTGTFRDMFRQSVLDPKAFQSTQDYPTPLGYFYHAGNWNLYGSGGRSPTWMYSWTLPVVGFAGAFLAFINFLAGRDKSKSGVLIPALGGGLVLQWGLLFTLHTVLLQYYIPVLWLFSIFSAYALSELINALEHVPSIRTGTLAALFVLFLFLAMENYSANMLRSKLDSHDFINYMNTVWAHVPPNAKVFPMTLFRPPGFPVHEGYFAGVHSGLLDRYPPVETYLEKDKIPYVLASDYTIGYLKGETQAYIRSKYTKITSGFDLMKRTETINTAQQ